MKASKISIAIVCGAWIICATPAIFAKQNEGISAFQIKKQAPQIQLEELLLKAKVKHPDMQVISTYSETTQKNNAVEKIYYMLPSTKGAWIMTLDRINGDILNDHLYKLPEQAEVLPLETILQDVKRKYRVKKVLRTRLEQENGQKLRIIYYINNRKQQRTMVVDGKTGAILSDKARNMTSTG